MRRPARLLTTVRARTTLFAVVVVAIALLIASVGLVVLQGQVLRDGLDGRLRQRITDLTASVEGGDDPAGLLGAAVGDDTIVQIVDQTGTVLASTLNLDNEHPIIANVATDEIGFIDVDQVELAEHDESFRVAFAVVRAPNGDPLVIYAGAPDENVAESVGALSRGLAIATPLLLALLGGVLWYVTGRSLRPVNAIRTRADQIGADELDQRVPTTGTGDEIDRLANTMNRMLSRLESSAEQQRVFIADASHELRTPLTGIIAQLEAAATSIDADAYRLAGAVTLVEAQRMRRLVEDLLTLARSEPTAGQRRKRLVDIDDIVLDEVAHHPTAEVAVDTSRLSAGQIRGDPDEIRRILRNLLDNAVRHARSRVTIQLLENERDVELTVGDDGPGISEADSERVFDRFVRLDSARTRAAGGTGLGLAISKALAEAHNGSITVDRGPLGGAQFTVRFPAAGS